MFHRKTVFVLGAGASQEVDLPTGAELRDKVAALFDFRVDAGSLDGSYGDGSIHEALRRLANANPVNIDINPYLRAGWHLRDALPQSLSVDNLLDAHRDDKLFNVCGKLGIARSILRAEQKSKLAVQGPDQRATMTRLVNGTWFGRFWHLLSEGLIASDVSTIFSKVSFVSFNYDRCIEHFLENAVANYYYGLNEANVAEVMKSLTVLHPYGAVGPLHWQSVRPEETVPYGSQPSDLTVSSARLKTFTERVEDPAFIARLGEAMTNAEAVVFLGFAFHPQNMQLLRRTAGGRHLRVYATTSGISKSDVLVVRDSLVKVLQVPESGVRLFDGHCAALFNEFRLSLPLGY